MSFKVKDEVKLKGKKRYRHIHPSLKPGSKGRIIEVFTTEDGKNMYTVDFWDTRKTFSEDFLLLVREASEIENVAAEGGLGAVYTNDDVENYMSQVRGDPVPIKKPTPKVSNFTHNNDSTKELVHNPSHYQSSDMEAIDVIEAFNLDFKLGNAIKYILRAGKKDSEKTRVDLEKALWYINRYIEKEIKK